VPSFLVASSMALPESRSQGEKVNQAGKGDVLERRKLTNNLLIKNDQKGSAEKVHDGPA